MTQAKLEAKLTATSKQYDKTMNRAKKRAQGLGKTFGALGGLIGGALSIRAITGFMDKLDLIGKAADRVGVTTAEMQKLQYAAQIGGKDISMMEKAFKRMNVVIYDAKYGSTDAVRALKSLGISLEDVENMTPLERMNAFATALSNVANFGEKSALAQKIFGRSGTEMLPILKDITKLGNELQARGGIIDEKTIRNAEKFNDNLTRMSKNLQAALANSGFFDKLAAATEVLANFNKIIQDIKRGEILAKQFKLEGAKGGMLEKNIWGDIMEAPAKFLFGEDYVKKYSLRKPETFETQADPQMLKQIRAAKIRYGLEQQAGMSSQMMGLGKVQQNTSDTVKKLEELKRSLPQELAQKLSHYIGLK